MLLSLRGDIVEIVTKSHLSSQMLFEHHYNFFDTLISDSASASEEIGCIYMRKNI